MEAEPSTLRYGLIGGTPKTSWFARRWPVLHGVVGAAAAAVVVLTSSGTTTSAPALGGAEPAGRLRIVNGCDTPLFIASFAGAVPFKADVKLAGGASHDFDIPDEGLAATRFWPKWGCDASGAECKIGGSGGPGQSCIAKGCAPPVDSKFEASFGCVLSDAAGCASNPSDPTQKLGPVDWWDVSQVDGWTLPYKVEVHGACDGPKLIDCSSLSLSSCPKHEDLGSVGTHSLQVVDPTDATQVVGCYSPCAKLTYSNWDQGYSFTPEQPAAQDYCCPTPPISAAECSKGPVIATEYVRAVHKLCPSVYAYAYDDGVGLAQCPGGTKYEVTFYCPG